MRVGLNVIRTSLRQKSDKFDNTETIPFSHSTLFHNKLRGDLKLMEKRNPAIWLKSRKSNNGGDVRKSVEEYMRLEDEAVCWL